MSNNTEQPGLPIARTATLDELQFDRNNANRGNEFGQHLLRKSVSELGIGRGIVAAADGTIIGGNHVTEMLAELGIDNVVMVPTDGKTLVVTQRMDIQPGSRQFHELALADNQVGAENLTFDMDVVSRLADEFDINLDSWGMGDMLDDAAPQEKQERGSKKDDSITFKLTESQLAILRRALETAALEGEIPPGEISDSLSLMRIVNEFITRRS